jgi:hypothetical protein
VETERRENDEEREKSIGIVQNQKMYEILLVFEREVTFSNMMSQFTQNTSKQHVSNT